MRKYLFTILLLLSTSLVYGESISLTTYYPAPQAVYDRVRLVPRNTLGSPCDIGTMYMNKSYEILYCSDNGLGVGTWGPLASVWEQDGNDVYPIGTDSNPDLYVGIGTNNPQYPLHVANQGEIILDHEKCGSNIAAIRFIESGGSYHYQLAMDTFMGTPVENRLYLQEWTGSWENRWALNLSGMLGIGTDDPLGELHVVDGNIVAEGTYGNSPSISVSGAGKRLMWYPRKAAFRAGGVSGNLWDDSDIGEYSTAIGYDVRANGTDGAFSAGIDSQAFGTTTVALGDNAEAKSNYSMAIGHDAIAQTQTYNLAIGHEALAEGQYSTSIGYKTRSSGHMSTAIGKEARAVGDTTYAIGTSVISSGSCNSFVIGYSSQATSDYSVATGLYNSASDAYAYALGYNTKAEGDNSIAFGKWTRARGDNSISFGRGINVTGTYSVGIALGDLTGVELSQDNTMAILGVGVGINTLTPTEELEVNGNILASGNITGNIVNTSSRKYKKDIKEFSYKDAVDTLKNLDPVKYNFIDNDSEDVHIGFIAEDVPDLVSTPERKGIASMDIAATLIKVVQFQQEQIKKQKEIMESQQKQIDGLMDKVNKLQKGL